MRLRANLTRYMIHVWYIYLHLVDFDGKLREGRIYLVFDDSKDTNRLTGGGGTA